ncbi:MAG: glycoside hydrolase family 99-like domain-containing protein [Planctomycetia bacterium]|jgi:GT2 family glycosyltransferase
MRSQTVTDLKPYFDAAWYVTRYGRDRGSLWYRPWANYRRRGWRRGRSPRQLFDAAWYRRRYPDVVAAGVDPLLHYVTHGWREGRSPHPAFDVSWYLRHNDDVAAAGAEPLLHYLTQGWREGRSPHPLFDAAGYLAAHEDVAAAGIEPLSHYLGHGWKEGRQPHPLFDADWYLARYPDVAAAGIEPLTHFLEHGWQEGREASPKMSLAAYVACRPRPLDPGVNPLVHFIVTEYEPVAHSAADAAELVGRYAPADVRPQPPAAGAGSNSGAVVRAIATYLPQFHRVPENDRWWGEGFTEWTNVRRGRPMFTGHHQPHVPHPDVGYYDLDDEMVLERQAAMARKHGIHGFCFYHYWFDGRRILEKPVERLLRSGRPDFPFCLCWANENWTRTWDGHDREVLLEQRHSPESDERFIRELLPALRDPRYIRVEGKPLLAVYRPGLLATPAETAARWRAICAREGLPGLHLVAFHSFDRTDPRTYGFDAAVEFPPLQIPTVNLALTGMPGLAPEFRGGVLDYRAAMSNSLSRPTPEYPLYRGVMPGWDNTARRMERGTVWVNSSPERYGLWLRGTIDRMRREQPPERQIVFINAWNEWAEGAHLEPDCQNGYGNLQQTAAALIPAPAATGTAALRRDRHEPVRRQRVARLRLLFGGCPPEPMPEFLDDHVAALAGLVAAGHTLRCDAGRPVAFVGDTAFPLDGPAAVSRAVAAAAGCDRPFVFVVLQYNQPEVTLRCVASLRRLAGSSRRVHVVVVDNGSTPAAVVRTRQAFAGMADVTLLVTNENLGFARGNNVGYRHARDVLGADFIAVINNDTVVEDTAFVEKCLASFAEEPWSVLGPDIVTPDGRRENPWTDHVYEADEWAALGRLYERQRDAWLAGGTAEFRRLGDRSPEAARLRQSILQGAAFVFSPVFTSEREQVFDERTFLYGEEFLLAVDCLLTGHATVYDPRIIIAHEEGVSTAKLPERSKIENGYRAVIETAAICRARLERLAAAARGACLEPDDPAVSRLVGDGRTHVLVDLFFSQPGPHGGGEYGKAVFKALVATAAGRGDVQLWAAIDPALFIDDWVWQACRDHGVNVVAVKSYDDIVRLVDAGHFTSFFAPAIVVYTGYEYMKRVGGDLRFVPGRTRVIGTLHDLRDLALAEEWDRIARARRTAGCRREMQLIEREWAAEAERQRRHAEALQGMYEKICASRSLDALITVSNYAATSIASRLGDTRQVTVLYSPEKDRAVIESFAWPGIDLASDPFALVVNAGREEKNAASIVAAFERLFADPQFGAAWPGLRVVLTGLGDVADLGLGRLRHAERFVCLPHLPAGRLEYLLARAKFLAYASFNEGFGYPPLEAMTHGTPSLIGANTSVPEVCGAAAVTCDPFDLESIAAGIRTILATPPAPETLRKQLAATAERQRRDVRALADLICSRVSAAATSDATGLLSLSARAA